MAKSKFHITFQVENPGVVVTEYLRYADIISVAGLGHTGHPPHGIELRFVVNPDAVLVTIDCPSELDGKVWIRQNVNRMNSFGVKAIGWSDTRGQLSIVYGGDL